MKLNSIKELRKKNKYTQKDISKLLNINRSTVTKWELGKSFPRADLLPKIAEILNCSIDDLYNNERR